MSSIYPQTTALTLERFYSRTFSAMEALITQHQSFGNWAVGGIPVLEPKPAQKALGLWYAEGRIPGFSVSGAVSIALIPGEARLGLFLPYDCLLGDQDRSYLEDRVARSYNGKDPDIIVRYPDRILFDRIFTDAPLDTDTLAIAQTCEDHPKSFLLAQRLAYMVVTLWVSAIRVVYAHGRTGSENFLVRSKELLEPDHLLGLPTAVLIQTHELGVDDYIGYVRTSGTPEQVAEHLRSQGISVLDVERMEVGENR